MEHYDYARLTATSFGIDINITDDAELKALMTELNKLHPQMSVSNIDRLPGGEVFYCRIKELGGKDSAYLWWIVKYLCRRGWEPLGAVSVTAQGVWEQLRRKTSD